MAEKAPRKRPTVRLGWEPRDLWIGAYWTREWGGWWDSPVRDGWSVYVCLVPCVPIHVRWGGIDWHRLQMEQSRRIEDRYRDGTTSGRLR